MSRVRALRREEFSPELRESTASIADEDLGHLRVFANSPGIAVAWINFLDGLREGGTLPSDLIELVRLRIAFHNQCPHCMAVRFDDGVSEAMVCSLEKPEESPDLTDLQRAALRFADAMATNHFAIDGAMYDDLRAYFTEAQLVELGIQSAVFVGFGRLGFSWHVTDDIPERYGQAAPGELHFGSDSVRIGHRDSAIA